MYLSPLISQIISWNHLLTSWMTKPPKNKGIFFRWSKTSHKI